MGLIYKRIVVAEHYRLGIRHRTIEIRNRFTSRLVFVDVVRDIAPPNFPRCRCIIDD